MMPGARRVRLPWGVPLAAGLLAGTGAGRPALAQGVWDARLDISPYPSPYLSDWESNPTIGTLTITNPTAADQSVLLAYRVTDHGGRVIASGRSDPQVIVTGPATALTDFVDLTGTSEHDQGIEDQMRRTGRLPEGDHTACVAVTDAGGFVLAEDCATFTIVYPDPPYLIGPLDDAAVTSGYPVFQWTPLQVPPAFQLAYVLRVSEVLTGQTPAQALVANIPVFETTTFGTNLEYPIGAPPLEETKLYAWRVQALDQNGYAASSNEGRSEVWTFTAGGGQQRIATSIALTPDRDTLRFSGDTARFLATALDRDDVEIPGKRFRWRSADTTVARVDTTGVVTGVGAGETWIVASVDDAADSAFSVTVLPTGLAVRFEQYDAATATPSLLELIQSGTFEEVVPQLMARLQAGEFRIPIPRFPGMGGGPAAGGDGGAGGVDGAADDGPSASHGGPAGGPRMAPSGGAGLAGGAADPCSDLAIPAVPVADPANKVWVVPLRLGAGDAEVLARKCIAVDLDSVMVVDTTERGNVPDSTGRRPGGAGPPEVVDTTYIVTPDTTTDTTWTRAAVFVVSWKHPGLPRVFLAFMRAGLELAPAGSALRSRYWVVNVGRATTIGSDLLPKEYAGFFGDDSFEAGWGLTMRSTRVCTEANGLICRILRTTNPHNPELTVHAFLGVTASETSRSFGSSSKVGSSLALGLSVQASGGVRRFTADEGGLDSLQLGVLLAVQDSLVQTRDSLKQSWSIGVAPMATIWWTGSGGNNWEATAAIGLEWDPTEDGVLSPSLVASAQMPAIWKFLWLRVGSPTVVFKTPIGARVPRKATTLALSGSWGVGPWDRSASEAIGVSDGGGGRLMGDIGASSGGDAGFEELGRAGVEFNWIRVDNASVVAQAGDSLRHWQRVARDLRGQLDADEDDEEKEQAWRRANRRVFEWQRLARCSGRVVGGRCLTWTANLSVGNGSLLDLMGWLVRVIPGVP